MSKKGRSLTTQSYHLSLLFSLKPKEIAKTRLLAWIWIYQRYFSFKSGSEKRIVISQIHHEILKQKNFTGSGLEGKTTRHSKFQLEQFFV